jgi:hypothetical protein
MLQFPMIQTFKYFEFYELRNFCVDDGCLAQETAGEVDEENYDEEAEDTVADNVSSDESYPVSPFFTFPGIPCHS